MLLKLLEQTFVDSSINQCCKIQDIEKAILLLPIHAFIAFREIYLDREN